MFPISILLGGGGEVLAPRGRSAGTECPGVRNVPGGGRAGPGRAVPPRGRALPGEEEVLDPGPAPPGEAARAAGQERVRPGGRPGRSRGGECAGPDSEAAERGGGGGERGGFESAWPARCWAQPRVTERAGFPRAQPPRARGDLCPVVPVSSPHPTFPLSSPFLSQPVPSYPIPRRVP